MDIGPLQWNSIVCLACLSVYHGDSSLKCEKKSGSGCPWSSNVAHWATSVEMHKPLSCVARAGDAQNVQSAVQP